MNPKTRPWSGRSTPIFCPTARAYRSRRVRPLASASTMASRVMVSRYPHVSTSHSMQALTHLVISSRAQPHLWTI